MPEFLSVDPGDLFLPRSRKEGADPAKLARQISRFGDSIDGMPPIEVYRDLDGRLIIVNGVTRATRVAKLLPGTHIDVEVTGVFRARYPTLPTVREKLP
jgi:hypothetical protein